MKKIVMFCSNPVNGGTARMFAEVTRAWGEADREKKTEIIPCVNEKNPVDIYKTFPELVRLPVYSEVEICGAHPMHESRLKKIKLLRKRAKKYAPVKEKNIETMTDYLKTNGIYGVIIHNGGYVGDDLCNQMLEAAYKAGCEKRVMVFHNDYDKKWYDKIRYRGYDKNMDKWATDLTTVSNYTRDRIKSRSYIKKEIQVIYNGITVTEDLSTEEKEAKLPLKKDRVNALMIGNFTKEKGQLYMLKAWKKVKERGANAHLTIIGNVYEKDVYDAFEKYRQEEGLTDSTTVYHGITNASEYTDMFDFMIVPSLVDESFGLISAEAMSKGIPVAATDCGGIPEVVEDGRDGLLCPVGDEDALAKNIQRLIDDAPFRKQCGVNAKEDFEKKFSVGIMAAQYYSLV